MAFPLILQAVLERIGSMQVRKINAITFVEADRDEFLLGNERDTVDLIGFCGEHEATGILLYPINVSPDFFDLKTGFLGMVLQKFVNYHLKAALVLSREFVRGRFKEFATESNRSNHFRTFCSREDAEKWLIC